MGLTNRHIIVKIQSFEGEDTYLRCGSDDQDFVFAVVAVDPIGNAQVIDSGYRSYSEAAAAWPEAAPRDAKSMRS